MGKIFTVGILIMLSLVFTFDSNAQMLAAKAVSGQHKDERPPLNALRIASEIGAGTVAGLLGIALPVSLVELGSSGEFGGLFVMVTIVPITYTLGSVAGVYLMGSLGDEKGSFPATLLGGIAGGVVSIVTWAFCIDGKGFWSNVGMWAGFIGAPVGATIAFNLTRKSEKASASAAPPISFSMNLMKMAF